MKNFFISLLLVSVSTSLASQIILEHSYPCQFLQRVNLETAGEKFYCVDFDASVVRFFNADHTPWKTVPVSLPANNNGHIAAFASEHIFNQDDAMEFLLISFGANSERVIYNENGDEIFSFQPYGFNVVQVNGEWKITTSNGFVISANGFEFEHQFPKAVTVISVENEGDKYFYRDNQENYLFFNPDFTLWKQVTPAIPDAECTFNYLGEVLLTYHGYDDDSNLEFVVWGNCPLENKYVRRLIDESGEVQFQYQGGTGAGYFSSENVPDGAGGRQWVVSFADSTVFYSLPDFDFVQHFPFEMNWGTISNVGFKFYQKAVETTASSQFQFYNADLTPWKQMPKPAGYSATIYQSGENLFTNDNSFTALVAYSTFSESGIKILTETGQELLSLVDANIGVISEIPGLSRKLLLQHYETEPAIQKFSNVYALPEPTTATKDGKASSEMIIKTLPNPFSDFLSIDFSETGKAVAEITILDILGTQKFFRKEIKSTRMEVSGVSAWPSGMYVLQVKLSNGDVFSKKMVKS